METWCVILVQGYFFSVCSSVIVMRLQDTPSIFTLFGKSPLPIQQEVSLAAGGRVFCQTLSDLYLCPELFRMGSFGQKHPLGCCTVYYFVIVVMCNPSSMQTLEEASFLVEYCHYCRQTGMAYQWGKVVFNLTNTTVQKFSIKSKSVQYSESKCLGNPLGVVSSYVASLDCQ